MKRFLAISSTLLGWLVTCFAPAWSQVVAHSQATTIVCPTSASVNVSGDHAMQGWTSVSSASATLNKAEVVNAVGLTGPMLTCSYTMGTVTALEIGRLSRPEPAGMLCTVNAVKAAQFDCFARPAAN